MNPDDYAIVVGISSYPGLGKQGQTADLQAATTDAEDIAQWLVLPAGGGLTDDKVHVQLVTAKTLPAPQFPGIAQPQAFAVRQAFRNLDDIAQENLRTTGKTRIGRRLYIYMSGHGFSPQRRAGALYTGDASSRDPLHSNASGWLDWFQEMAYFDEYVLWMDCCMDRIFAVVLEATFTNKGAITAEAGPTFIGLAAHRSLKTVERLIDGKMRGVFTWTLLQGLKGAAVDPATNEVNGRSLGDHLINALKQYLTPEDLADPDISKEPEIVQSDQRLILVKNPPGKSKCPVIFSFDTALAGQQAQVWGGQPPAPQQVLIDASGHAKADLAMGLYVVELATAGLRQGFEVTSATELNIAVQDKGPPVVAAADKTFRLAVFPNLATAEVIVVDHALALSKHTSNRLDMPFAFGLYKVKLRIGRDIHECIVLLDRNTQFTQTSNGGPLTTQDPAGQLILARPRIASAAPLAGSDLTHEYHVSAANELRSLPLIRPPSIFGRGQLPATAEIRIMARVWTSPEGGSPNARPWKDVELRSEDGRPILKLGDLPSSFPHSDPFVTTRQAVVPGHYFLHQKLEDGRAFEQSLIVPKDWALEVFLLAVADPPTSDTAPAGDPALRRCSVLMKSLLDHGPQQDLDELVETARIALVDQRNIMNHELEHLLLGKLENPLAGLLGAHLLIAKAERDPASESKSLSALNEIVPNLRSLLGSHHPDVEAISLKCPDEALRTTLPFHGLPMLEGSWRLMVAASENNPSLVPASLWDRVRAAMSISGLLIWATDTATRNSHAQQLQNWVREMTAPAAAEPASAAAGENVVLESMMSPVSASAGPLRRLRNMTPIGKIRSKAAKLVKLEPAELARKLGVPAAAMSELLEKKEP